MTQRRKKLGEQVQAAESKITQLNARRDELTDELEQACGDLSDVQSAVIDGEEGAGEQATQLQAKINSLESTLEALDARRAEKRRERDTFASEQEAEAMLEKLSGLAEKAEEAKGRFQNKYVELAESLEELLPEIDEVRQEWRQHARQFRDLAGRYTEDCTDHSFNRRSDSPPLEVQEEMKERGASLTAVRERAKYWASAPAFRYSPPVVGEHQGLIDGELKRMHNELRFS